MSGYSERIEAAARHLADVDMTVWTDGGRRRHCLVCGAWDHKPDCALVALKAALQEDGETIPDVTEEMVERAAYPLFVGVARAPWTSRGDDEPCPVKAITKNACRNIARVVLRSALMQEGG